MIIQNLQYFFLLQRRQISQIEAACSMGLFWGWRGSSNRDTAGYSQSSGISPHPIPHYIQHHNLMN